MSTPSPFTGYCPKHDIRMMSNCPCPICAYDDLKFDNVRLTEQLRVAREALQAAPEQHYPNGQVRLSAGSLSVAYADWNIMHRQKSLALTQEKL